MKENQQFVVAMDSFKGCLTSEEAGYAAKKGIVKMLPNASVLVLPLSDGGEGMMETFCKALSGHHVNVIVHDPMMRRINANYAISGETAIIEVAKACGFQLVSKEERNPLVATSYGVGEMVVDALKKGCKRFIIGLGGTATSDGGIGMLKALVDMLGEGKNIDFVMKQYLDKCNFVLACDVTNPLCGPTGAAMVFARQKGASDSDIKRIEQRMIKFKDISSKHLGHDYSNMPGAGAAGGLGYAFLEYMNAQVKSGADYLLDMVDFDKLVTSAACVITGEGSSDSQTLMGKLPFVVMNRTKCISHSIPVWLLSGRISDKADFLNAGFDKVICINDMNTNSKDVLKSSVATVNIELTVEKCIKESGMSI